MDDLVQWLRAQLDADGQRAQTALANRDGVWRYVETPGGDHRVVDSLGYSVVEESSVESAPWFTLPHVAEWDPFRVLAETDAKRQTVQLLAETIEASRSYKGPDYYDGIDACGKALRLLALPYKARPGYAEAIASAE